MKRHFKLLEARADHTEELEAQLKAGALAQMNFTVLGFCMTAETEDRYGFYCALVSWDEPEDA
jgi:hypothetical protein